MLSIRINSGNEFGDSRPPSLTCNSDANLPPFASALKLDSTCSLISFSVQCANSPNSNLTKTKEKYK